MSNRKHDEFGQHIYGERHRKERKRWAGRVTAGVVDCWRCGEPIDPSDPWDLGHVDEDGRRRGFPTRHPEHRSCNRATMTHLKQKLAAANPPPSTASRDW